MIKVLFFLSQILILKGGSMVCNQCTARSNYFNALFNLVDICRQLLPLYLLCLYFINVTNIILFT